MQEALPACAAIATRGSVNTSVPFDPATAEITPGPAANTTGIQVRALLFFGGNLAAESFHAATICQPTQPTAPQRPAPPTVARGATRSHPSGSTPGSRQSRLALRDRPEGLAAPAGDP
jgi:hypothetical protein